METSAQERSTHLSDNTLLSDKVMPVDGRWAIRGLNAPWWSVQTHTEEALPILVEDDWFGPGWKELTLYRAHPVST